MLAAVKRTRLKRVHLCFIKDWQGAPWARPAHELKQWPAVNLLPSLYPDVQVTIASLHSILKATWSSSTASPSHPAQEEFRFFMEDAGSKLLVLPFKGNAAAEGAAAELGTPTASLSVSSFNGKLSPGRRGGVGRAAVSWLEYGGIIIIYAVLRTRLCSAVDGLSCMVCEVNSVRSM